MQVRRNPRVSVLRVLRLLGGTCGCCLAMLPTLVLAQNLIVVSWGGSYGRAMERAWINPFMEATGISVQVEDYNGGLAQIRAQVESGNVFWDIVDLTTPDAVRACDEGLLELVNWKDIPPAPDGTPAIEDFYPDTRSDCAGGGIYSSTIYAYNDLLFPDKKPATLEDFFDLEKFPGRRGMRRYPIGNLEFALIADGVPLDEIYDTLDTDAGMDRAFAKLDTIKDQIVFWETGAQPPQMLADQEVVMTTAYNGRIFNAQVLEQQPFTIVWDGQVLETGGPTIVLGTPRLELAREFIEFISRSENLASISKYISYSPTRRSGNALVGKHLDTGTEMQPHMPASEQNLVRSIQSSSAWWSDNGDEMNELFSVWLSR